MADEDVQILVTLKNIQSFISQTKEAGAALRGIATGASEAGAKSSGLTKVTSVVDKIKTAAKSAVTSLAGLGREASTTSGKASTMMSKIEATSKKPLIGGGVAGQLGAMALGGLSVQGIKDAVNNTTELAKTAQSYHQVTGMSTKDAAAWSAVVQANGLNAKAFGLALKSSATQVSNFAGGNKTSAKLMQQLGISMNDVKAHGNDMNSMFNEIVDKFDKMPAGANKTAVATKLFGRNWQALLPLLSQGSKGMEAERNAAEKLGVSFGGNAAKNAAKFHESQVMLKLAVTGLQVQLAEHLLPVLMKLVPPLIQVAGVMLNSLNPAFKVLGAVVNAATGFFSKHKDLAAALKPILIALAAAWALGKVQIVASKAAMVLLNKETLLGKIGLAAYKVAQIAWIAVTQGATAAQEAFNVAMDANPIGMIMLAIIALIVVIVLIIKHWSQVKAVAIDCWNWVKKAANDAWNFIKNIASKIAAPFISAWNWIKNAARNTWNFIKVYTQTFYSNLLTIAKKIAQPFVNAWNWIKTTANNVFKWMKDTWNGAINLFKVIWNKITQPFIDAWNTIKTKATDAFNFIKGIPGQIAGAFKTLGSDIISPFQTAFNWVRDHIPKVSVSMGSFHGIPYPKVSVSAQQGNVMRGTGLALVGEAGPEVVHLPHGAQISPIPRPSGASDRRAVSPTTKSMPPFIVSVQINRKEIARAVGKYTSDQLARK